MQNKSMYKGLIFLIYFLFLYPLCVYSQTNEYLVEYKIKAAYLYNFTKFITWPSHKQDTFNLCIFGEDPFGSLLTPIEKRKVKNKPIRLFYLEDHTETAHCQIIYITDEQKIKASILDHLNNQIDPILTVSDFQNFNHLGGMITFNQKQGKIKILLNLSAIRNSGLDISAKLIEVAEITKGQLHD